MRTTAAERRQAKTKANDKATPCERRWLDKLERVRPDMAPLVINDRGKGDTFGEVEILWCLRNRLQQRRRGVYMLTLGWIQREVRRLKRRHLREQQQDIQAHIGAYI